MLGQGKKILLQEKKLPEVMNRDKCCERSQAILRKYAENTATARLLAEGQRIHSEFFSLLDMMETIRQNWNAQKSRADALQEKINTKEDDNSELRQKNRIYKEQLRDARAQIATLMSDKQNLERAFAEMEKRFALVNELLKDEHLLLKEEDRQKLAFLDVNRISHELHSIQTKTRNTRRGISCRVSRAENDDDDKTADSMDISYDDSDESYLRNGKVYKRSQSLSMISDSHHEAMTVKRPKESAKIDMVEEEMITPSKRSKDGTEATETVITTTTTITVDPEGRKPAKASVTIRRSMNRSISESNILNKKEEWITESNAKLCKQTPRYGASALELRSPDTIKTWTNGASIETRPHHYANFTSILGDRCEVCNRWIGIAGKAAYKCTDCGMRLHKSCASNAAIPCIPRTPTPRTPGKQRPRLKDFCPSVHPMIPPLIIHCVLALDRKHLRSEGIYRIPGQESQVAKLLNEFKNGRSLPKLDYHDTETITGCIKRFLREIRDPVIPASSWNELLSAAENEDFEALNHSVMDLSYPNRDTLAFLCAHFQRVCGNSAWNKMTPEVLARSIAPTIVGRAPMRAMNMVQNAEEVGKQIKVMLALLRMPRDYWSQIYSYDQGRPLLRSPTGHPVGSSICNEEIGTPFRPPLQRSDGTGRKDLNRSMLGETETSLTTKEG